VKRHESVRAEVGTPLQAEAGPEVQIKAVHREEAHRLVILHALEEVIPPDAAADTTERKDQITRSLLLQV